MELFFEKGSLTEDEMRKGIKLGMMDQSLFPVFCTSAKRNIGLAACSSSSPMSSLLLPKQQKYPK